MPQGRTLVLGCGKAAAAMAEVAAQHLPGEVTVDFRTLLFNSLRLTFFIVYELLPADRERAIADLDALLRSGQLRHTVAQTFALVVTEANAPARALYERLGMVTVGRYHYRVQD